MRHQGYLAGLLACVAILIITGCRPVASDALIASVQTAAADLASYATDRNRTTVIGRDGWLFFAPELRHVSVGQFWGERAVVVSQARDLDTTDPLPAILDFKQQLDALGVDLLLVPVPAKSLIYPDRLADDFSVPLPFPRLDAAHQEFYAILRDSGIDVLDLMEPFLDDRYHSDGPLYCRKDTHWSGVGCVLAGRAIAKETRSRPWFPGQQSTSYSAGWESISIDGDLTADVSPTPVREELRLRRIVQPDPMPPQEVSPDPTSPLVLLGDSHGLVFHAGDDMHTTGAGLADQLAFELGFAVDLVAVRGSGATAARVNLLRRAQRDSEYWSNKRLVVWCFSVREFTESDGWSLVPLTP